LIGIKRVGPSMPQAGGLRRGLVAHAAPQEAIMLKLRLPAPPLPLALGLTVALLTAAAGGAQPGKTGPVAWRGCCGLTPWAQATPLKPKPRSSSSTLLGGYAYVEGGSSLRHQLGITGQIPAPYATMHNPLPATPQNAQRGAAVYTAQCASCHGATGLGDGPASHTLKPPPAQMGWLAKAPTDRLDPYMYWTIAEGGAAFHTAMPAYKGKLSDEQIWAVTGYIQARLPKPAAAH